MLNVHVELTERIQHGESEFHVERTLDHRRTDWQFRLKIKWFGLEKEI
jgi:hypothetical protein